MEPNDNIFYASSLSLEDNIRGKIADGEDVDCYKIKVEEEGELDINFTCLEKDRLNLRFYGSDSLDSYIVDKYGQRGSLDIPVKPGTYYLALDGNSYTEGFEYILSTKFTASGMESGAGSSFAKAKKIEPSGSYKGSLSYYTTKADKQGVDHYSFELEDDGTLDFDIVSLDNKSLGVELYEDKYNQEPLISSVFVTETRFDKKLKAGKYYIVVYNKSNAGNRYEFNIDFK